MIMWRSFYQPIGKRPCSILWNCSNFGKMKLEMRLTGSAFLKNSCPVYCDAAKAYSQAASVQIRSGHRTVYEEQQLKAHPLSITLMNVMAIGICSASYGRFAQTS